VRKILIGVAVFAAIAAALVAAFYSRPHPQRSSDDETAAWVVRQHMPRSHLMPGARLVGEFGPWRVTCKSSGQAETPRFGFIQDFGITRPPGIDTPTNGCAAGIFLRSRSAARQFIALDFRFIAGHAGLKIVLAFPQFADNATQAELRLSGRSLLLITAACPHARCIAHLDMIGSDVGAIESTQQLALLFRASAGGKVHEIDLPAQTLAPALSALRNLT
jgi:hypothetical protein